MSSDGVGGSSVVVVSSDAVSNGAMRVARSDICGMAAIKQLSYFSALLQCLCC